MKARLIRIALAVCIALSATPAAADTLTVGLGESDYPPYHYDVSGEPKGFCIDLVTKTAERMDLDIRFVRYPWNRLMEMMRKGTLDAILPVLRTPERETYMIFPETDLAKDCNALYSTVDTDVSYDGDLNTLRGIPIATVLNYSYGKRFDTAQFLLHKRSYTDREAILKVLSGKVPVGVGNVAVIQYYAEQEHQRERLRIFKPLLTRQKLYIAFSRTADREDMAKAFEKALSRVKQETAAPVYPFCDQLE